MADFIALVERVETDAGTKNDPIATARLIARTKYEGEAWDWMLPSTSGKAGVEQTSRGGWVTVDDIASLCFKLVVSTPDGPMDPMHIIVAIVADAETLPAGTGAGFKASHFVAPLPASVSQRAASTWVGDVGKAAAEWMTVYPLAEHPTKADYMLANAPPHDLLANVEGVAMTSKSPASGFALDTKAPLSANLRLFLRSGRAMRFHVFCSAEGFSVQPDGVTLTSDSKAVIGKRIKDFAEWYATNDPAVLKHVIVMSRGSSWSYLKKIDERQGDWAWFADEFITFIQNGLASERAD